jgi:hypothetical protein
VYYKQNTPKFRVLNTSNVAVVEIPNLGKGFSPRVVCLGGIYGRKERGRNSSHDLSKGKEFFVPRNALSGCCICCGHMGALSIGSKAISEHIGAVDNQAVSPYMIICRFKRSVRLARS